MNLDPRRSYATRVALGLLVVLVVGAAVGAFTYQAVGATVEQSQTDALESQAAVQSDLVETILSNHREDTQKTGLLLGRFQLQGDGTTGRIRTLLSNEAATSNETLRYLYAKKQSGEIVASNDIAFEGETLGENGYELPESVDSVGETAVEFRSDGTPRWTFYTDTGTGHVLVKEVGVAAVTSSFRAIVGDSRTRVVNGEGAVVLDTANASTFGAKHTAGAGVTSPAVSAGLAGESGIQRLDGSVAGAGETVVVGYDAVPEQSWAVVTYAEPSTLYAVAGDTGQYVVALLAAIGVLLAGFALVVERPTLRALNRLEGDAGTLAGGDLDTRIESDRDDEIGAVFGSLETMRKSIRDQIRAAEEAREEAESAEAEADAQREAAEERRREAQEAIEQVEAMNDHLAAKATSYEETMAAVADGDLTARVDPSSDHEGIQRMGEQLNAVLDDLEATVSEVDAFASAVASSSRGVAERTGDIEAASDEVAAAVDGIAAGAEDQRDFLERVAGETEALSATVQEIAATADEVAATASETTELTEDGQRSAEAAAAAIEDVEATAAAAVDEVAELTERMDDVVGVVDVIRDIADQTNMLALNASIEAARAGKDGEGFAVVADEVKDLAADSLAHADDIETEVTAMQEQTRATEARIRSAREELAESVETVTTARETLAAVAEQVAAADDGMQEIDAAAGEQAERTEQVAAMVGDATDIATDTADEAESVVATVEGQSASLGTVAEAVRGLEAQADDLEGALDQFETGTVGDEAAVERAAGDELDGATSEGRLESVDEEATAD